MGETAGTSILANRVVALSTEALTNLQHAFSPVGTHVL